MMSTASTSSADSIRVTGQTQVPLAYRVHCSCGYDQVWLTWEHAWEKAQLHADWGHHPCLDGLFE